MISHLEGGGCLQKCEEVSHGKVISHLLAYIVYKGGGSTTPSCSGPIMAKKLRADSVPSCDMSLDDVISVVGLHRRMS